MKFEKTVKFDLYPIGDRLMEGVIFHVDIEIRDDNSIVCTGAVPDIDAIPYLESLGGKGAVEHWEQRVLEHFDDEDTCAEELGEAMSEEEYEQWESVLMGEHLPDSEKVEPKSIPVTRLGDLLL